MPRQRQPVRSLDVDVEGSLARAAWGGFLKAAREIAGTGTFTAFAEGAAGGELNRIFAGSVERRS